MSPQNSPHSTGVVAVHEALRAIVPSGFSVRMQLPLVLSDSSEPEPDIAVVRGHWRDFARQHPTTAMLVVEVADTTLEFDRTRKRAIYAASGISDYWIVNLNERQVEVYRAPVGREYTKPSVHRAGESFSLVGEVSGVIRVDDLLP